MKTLSQVGWGMGCALLLLAGPPAQAGGPAASPAGPLPAANGLDYAAPTVLVGDILPMHGQNRKPLFRSRRTAERSGATVRVSCEYTYPDGAVAARDRVRYEGGRLVAVETEEFQTGEKGVAFIQGDPKNPARQTIFYEYSVRQGTKVKRSTETEVLQNDTLVDDMIPGFIDTHWAALSQGTPVTFRYIALSRKETVGFRLVRDSETRWRGTPVLRVKMEPTSFIIARLVDPMYFVVEKSPPHRIFEYLGRTTPMLKEGTKFKDLDADTVFEWEPKPEGNSNTLAGTTAQAN